MYPRIPHFYKVKLGQFLIFDPKHRLWVFVRTASAKAVLTCINPQSKLQLKIKKIKISFFMKFLFYYS